MTIVINFFNNFFSSKNKKIILAYNQSLYIKFIVLFLFVLLTFIFRISAGQLANTSTLKFTYPDEIRIFLNNVDTVSANFYQHNDTWSIHVDLKDTGCLMTIKDIPQATLDTSDTSNIKNYYYGLNNNLHLTIYDSKLKEIEPSEFSDSPVLSYDFRNITTNPDLLRLYYLNTIDSKWYEATHPDSGAARGSNYQLSIVNCQLSIPVQHFSHWWLGSLTDTVTVSKRGDYDSVTILSGDTCIPALSFSIMGDTYAGGDTLEYISVRSNVGSPTLNNLITLKLYEDANADSLYQASDTLICTFLWGGSKWYSPPLTYKLGDHGNNFIITVEADTEFNVIDSMQLYIPVEGLKTQEENTGPVAAIQNSNIFMIKPFFSVDTEPFGAGNGLQNSALLWGDFDHDGDMDLIAGGGDGIGTECLIYYKNNNGVLVKIQDILGGGNGLKLCDLAAADYDGDGDLDFAGAGLQGANRRFIVFKNLGGNFVIACEPIGIGSGVQNASLTFFDYDRDGDQDIIVMGDNGVNNILRIFKNVGTDSFIFGIPLIGLTNGLKDGCVRAADFDRDGDLDIAAAGFYSAVNQQRLYIYKNNGNDSLTLFTELLGAGNGLEGAYLDWGDYNNDGYPDLAVLGQSGAVAGNNRLLIYKNTGGAFTLDSEPLGIGIGNGLYSGSCKWLDFNNDGWQDLAVIGQSASGQRRFIIFKNLGNNRFSRFAEPFGINAGLENSSVVAGDFDSDGDQDIAISGLDGINRKFIIFKNNSNEQNRRPESPNTNSPNDLKYTKGDSVYFQWTANADTQTPAGALTFNVYVKRAAFDTPLLCGSDTNSGNRFTSEMGLFNTNFAYLKTDSMAAGIYRWAVQSIDGGNMKSAWSVEKQFTVRNPFSDTGAMTIFVCNHGDSKDPLSGETSTAFSNIQSAIDATDTSNGFDTIVVYSSIGVDSYFQNITLKQGLTIISAKEYFGDDTGGGGNIYPTIGSSSDMGVTMKSVSTINGFKLNGTSTSGSHRGLYLITTDSAVMKNISVYNYEDGIYLMSSDNNVIQNCVSYNNGGSGLNFWGSSDTNIIKNNIFRNNSVDGITILGSNNLNNEIYQNQILENTEFACKLTSSGTGSIFTHNNLFGAAARPDSVIYTTAPNSFNFCYNFWNSSDTLLIAKKIWGSDSNRIIVQNFRTTVIDTFFGADTIAPEIPGIYNVDTSVYGQINLKWTKPANDENGATLGTGDSHLTGYRLYRARGVRCRVNGDTDNWETFLIFTADSTNDTDYTDTDITFGETYFYKIVAYDSHITGGAKFYNRSWYSAPAYARALSLPAYSGPKWYVNNDTMINDVYCLNVGNDSGNGSETYPFRTIRKALLSALSGETIYIDAGTYSETIVIDTNNISLIGADSILTIIDPIGDSNTVTLYGIYGDTQNKIFLKNLKVVDCYMGLYFINVDTSIIELVTFQNCGGGGGGYGMYLGPYCDSNIIQNCYSYNNYGGICFYSHCNYNIIQNNVHDLSTTYGFLIADLSDSNIIRNNFSRNTLSNDGIIISNSYNNNIETNVLTNNCWGIEIVSGGYNFIKGNFVGNSLDIGINIGSSTGNLIQNNISVSNINSGFGASSGTYRNTFINNYSGYNTSLNGNGFYVFNSNENYFAQNTADSNAGYGFYIAGTSAADTFEKNNFIPSISNPDSAVFTSSANTFKFINNYFSTADSSAIFNKISILAGSINWSPFRISFIDTSIGADTIAPATPGIYNVDTEVFGQIILKWMRPSTDENGNPLVNGDSHLAGYRLYRVQSTECGVNGDTDNWEQFLIFTAENADDTEFIDAGVSAGETYYYKIIAFDSHITNGQLFYNRSWYSAPYLVKTKSFADYICPNYADTSFTVTVNNIIGNETAYIIGLNKVDTLIVNVANPTGYDTWIVTLNPKDTGCYISLKSIPQSTLNTTDTSNIEKYNYGIGASLQADFYDSTYQLLINGYQFTDSPVLQVNYANRGITTNPDLLRFYYLNTLDSRWYEATHSDSGAANGSNYQLSIINSQLSIPVKHLSHWWFGSLTDTITVEKGIELNSGYIAKNDTAVVASIFIMGDTASGGDTLISFKIQNQGNINGSTADFVTLVLDTGIIGVYQPGTDFTVGNLTWVGDGWSNNALAQPISQNDTGSFFLVVIKTNPTVNTGDTFQAAIPVHTIKSSEENTGPVATITNFGIMTIIDTTLPNNWYVNISAGDTSYNGLTIFTPKKYIKNIISDNGIGLLTQGDTVNIANGIYAETIVIDTNNISLVGADSTLTIIDPPGDSTVANLYGISANLNYELRLLNLKITDCYIGIFFQDVDTSIIENVTITYCGSFADDTGGGIYLKDYCDSNTVKNSIFNNNNIGLQVSYYSKNNLITGNIAQNNNRYGYYSFYYCDSNIYIFNISETTNNIGISIKNYSQYNILRNNISRNNSGNGIQIYNSNYALLTGNLSNNNNGYGFDIDGSVYCEMSANTSQFNSVFGFSISGGSANGLFFDNISKHNQAAGFSIASSGDGKYLRNITSNNTWTSGHGFDIWNPNNLFFAQNTIDSNSRYGINIGGTPSGNNIFKKNNFIFSTINPDSAFFINCDSTFHLRNNYYGTTDSALVSAKITVSNGTALIEPYRLSIVDTAVGADTISPNTTPILSADTYLDGRIKIKWDTVTLNENFAALEEGDTGFTGWFLFR